MSFMRRVFALGALILAVSLLLVVSLASAQDATPTAEPTVEATAEATVEATVEATAEATVEPTVEAVATAEPTTEPVTTLPATGGEISPWFSVTLMAIGALIVVGTVVSLALSRRTR